MLVCPWHRFRLRAGPPLWRWLRRRPRLLAWVARTSPELRLRRRGGRLRGDDAARRRLEARLRPLDLIVDRGSPKLSDGLIPGFFTHAAVYLGPEMAAEVLRASGGGGALGSDDDPAVLEATRAGVRLTSLSLFLDVDSLAVLRGGPAGATQQRRFIERAAAELGKEYDYAFDLADGRRQYCCKLIFGLFPGLPFADLIGVGAALVPDDFVLPALAGRPGAPRLAHLVHDGVEIPACRRIEALARLLRDGRLPGREKPAIACAPCRTC